ncbi:MAG: hypothetical protein A3H97_11680 [Acidobacteria bacterium RIFCSPLOWO2_02_FULL_65_29]|nr:MAG: hypothetical protein A3H97_11680 [Acidobacteria bacterium RIFCSPLOWO2_02_FULL_65_29]
MAVSYGSIVLVASAAELPALSEQAAHALGQLFAFPDTDARRAWAVIAERRPTIIALERRFAGTARGQALIRRIRTDQSLTHAEIKMVSPETDFARLAPPSLGDGGPAAPAPPPSNQRVTRRAPRFRMASMVDVLVEGRTASLIDLSKLGAQVVSATVLKPSRRVRLTLSDERGTLRFSGVVAWAFLEISPTRGPQYRAGIEFIDARHAALDAYCARQMCREVFDVSA